MRFFIPIVLFSFIIAVPAVSFASTQDEINSRQKQIEMIQQQIEQYQSQIEQSQSQSKTLQSEINNLNAQINQLTLEIKSLSLSIDNTNSDINDTENKISDATDKLNKHKAALGQYLQIAYENDQKNLTQVLLKNATLSDFFIDIDNIRTNQDNLQLTINDIKNLKTDLQTKQEDLQNKKTDLEQMKHFQEVAKGSLNDTKSSKNQLLTETKGQEAKFQKLVQKSQADIEAIKNEITYLEQNGVTAEEAVKYGQLAAIATGIRPAFLIGILEIESGLGKNVGKGNWMDDMYQCYLRLHKPSRAETEKNAFLTIVGELGLDPNTVKVSAEPNYGCGGALGPAQFLPSIWLAYQDQVSRLTGHNPANPWNIEDAFMASAIKLAAGGATTKDWTGETKAAKAYIAGNPSCTSSICNYYARAVLNKATEIEANL